MEIKDLLIHCSTADSKADELTKLLVDLMVLAETHDIDIMSCWDHALDHVQNGVIL